MTFKRHQPVNRATPPCHRASLASPPLILKKGAFMVKGFGVARGLALLLAGTSIATIAHAGELAGNVADASGTRSLQAANVRIVELGRATTTARDGSYSFADVPAGTYTLETTYVGAEPVRQTVEVPETGRITVNIALSGAGGGDILVIGQAANQASALSDR